MLLGNECCEGFANLLCFGVAKRDVDERFNKGLGAEADESRIVFIFKDPKRVHVLEWEDFAVDADALVKDAAMEESGLFVKQEIPHKADEYECDRDDGAIGKESVTNNAYQNESEPKDKFATRRFRLGFVGLPFEDGWRRKGLDHFWFREFLGEFEIGRFLRRTRLIALGKKPLTGVDGRFGLGLAEGGTKIVSLRHRNRGFKRRKHIDSSIP